MQTYDFAQNQEYVNMEIAKAYFRRIIVFRGDPHVFRAGLAMRIERPEHDAWFMNHELKYFDEVRNVGPVLSVAVCFSGEKINVRSIIKVLYTTGIVPLSSIEQVESIYVACDAYNTLHVIVVNKPIPRVGHE